MDEQLAKRHRQFSRTFGTIYWIFGNSNDEWTRIFFNGKDAEARRFEPQMNADGRGLGRRTLTRTAFRREHAILDRCCANYREFSFCQTKESIRAHSREFASPSLRRLNPKQIQTRADPGAPATARPFSFNAKTPRHKKVFHLRLLRFFAAQNICVNLRSSAVKNSSLHLRLSSLKPFRESLSLNQSAPQLEHVAHPRQTHDARTRRPLPAPSDGPPLPAARQDPNCTGSQKSEVRKQPSGSQPLPSVLRSGTE